MRIVAFCHRPLYFFIFISIILYGVKDYNCFSRDKEIKGTEGTLGKRNIKRPDLTLSYKHQAPLNHQYAPR